jgi:hypothetical protein
MKNIFTGFIVAVLLTQVLVISTASPAVAITADLAKKCREMAIKAPSADPSWKHAIRCSRKGLLSRVHFKEWKYAGQQSREEFTARRSAISAVYFAACAASWLAPPASG